MRARRRVETTAQRAGECLITRVCRLVPDHERDLRRQEWVAEQASILDDTARPWLLRLPSLLGFPLSLAWSLRRGDWPAHQATDLFRWRATVNAVTTCIFIAYFLVPTLVSIGIFVGTAVGTSVAVAINAVPGSSVVSVPVMPADAGFPTFPTFSTGAVIAGVAGATAAIITVAGLTVLFARSWLSHRPPDRDVGQPAQPDR